MNWNDHSNLEGKHAVLAPSSRSWINYTSENNYAQLRRRCISEYATDIGTIIHDYAKFRIDHKIPINEYEKNDLLIELLRKRIPEFAIDLDQYFDILKEYVNDCIELGMDTEIPLYYSDNAFGHCDAIFYGKKTLKIFDFKSGLTPAHFDQLITYAAYFFLEYGKKFKIKPEAIDIELRIYQLGEVSVLIPQSDEIYDRMDKIMELDPVIDMLKHGGFKDD